MCKHLSPKYKNSIHATFFYPAYPAVSSYDLPVSLYSYPGYVEFIRKSLAGVHRGPQTTGAIYRPDLYTPYTHVHFRNNCVPQDFFIASTAAMCTPQDTPSTGSKISSTQPVATDWCCL